MNPFPRLFAQLKQIHRLSKLAMQLGLASMLCLYIISGLAYLLAPHVPNYFYAMSIHYGALEGAPACLAVGICAGLMGDLMLRNPSR